MRNTSKATKISFIPRAEKKRCSITLSSRVFRISVFPEHHLSGVSPSTLIRSTLSMFGLTPSQTILRVSATIPTVQVSSTKNTGLPTFISSARTLSVSIQFIGRLCLWLSESRSQSRYSVTRGSFSAPTKCQNQEAMLSMPMILLTCSALTL